VNNLDIKDKPESGHRDLIHTGAKAAISMIPGIGGAAAEILSQIIIPPISKRRDEWIESIANGLSELEEKMEDFNIENLSNNDLFITSFMHATQMAIRNHQKEKLEALRNAVLNTTLPNAPEEDIQLMFLNFIDTLTPWHLRVLKFFDNPIEWGKMQGINYPNWNMGGPATVLEHTFPELKDRRDFYGQLVIDLFSRGLMSSDNNSLHTTMTSHGMFESRTTNMGKQFIKYITSPFEVINNSEQSSNG